MTDPRPSRGTISSRLSAAASAFSDPSAQWAGMCAEAGRLILGLRRIPAPLISGFQELADAWSNGAPESDLLRHSNHEFLDYFMNKRGNSPSKPLDDVDRTVLAMQAITVPYGTTGFESTIERIARLLEES